MEKKKEVGENQKSVKEVLEMSTFYMVNQKYDKAIEVLKQALAKYPDDAELNYNLGLNYEALSKTEDAIDMYQKALAINPEHKYARKHLDRLMEIK